MLLSVAFTAAPALACLKIEGTIDTDADTADYVRVINNGTLVYHAGLGASIINGDYAVGCLPGYIYATRKDDSFAWYRNRGGAEFTFTQNHH